MRERETPARDNGGRAVFWRGGLAKGSVVSIEILDASLALSGLKERQVQLENLVAA